MEKKVRFFLINFFTQFCLLLEEEHRGLHPAPWEAAACAGSLAPGGQQCPLVWLHLLGFWAFFLDFGVLLLLWWWWVFVCFSKGHHHI